MNVREPLRDVENLRFRIQMNNRLRLECLAAVSKVFREFREPINDELLSSIVFALPQELISGNGRGKAQVEVMAGMDSAGNYEAMETGDPPEEPQKPTLPPQEPEPEKPGLPPQEPEQAPALPPQSPEEPPALPPVSPVQSAIA